MEFPPEKRKRLTKWLIGIATACIVIFLGLQNLDMVRSALAWCFGVVKPLFVGCAIAMILNVPMRFLETYLWRKSNKPFLCKARRPVAFILSLLFVLGILVGVVWIVIPELVAAIKILVQSAIDLIQRLDTMTEAELAAIPFGNVLRGVDWDQLLVSIEAWIKNQSGTILNTAFGTVTSLVGGIIDLFMAVVFSVYIVLGKERLKARAERILRAWLPKKADSVLHVSTILNLNFRNFIAGQSLEAVILAMLCLIGMWIFGFPYAPMISVLIGVTALVPVVGGFIGGGVGAFMMLTVDPIKAVWFVVFFLVLQQLEGNIIYPRVMGGRVNLPGMWVLAAVTVGGGIGGAVGMLLGVPLASTAYVLLKEETKKREAALTQTATLACEETVAEKAEESEEAPEETADSAEYI